MQSRQTLLGLTATMPDDPSFWESPENVEWFAGLDPDDGLLDLLASRRGTGPFRALDLGCAGGRNTESLVRAGCQTWALDLSPAMAVRTRLRFDEFAPSSGPRPFVVRGRFDQLPLRAASFDLVVAVGIYIQANSDDEFRAGLAETYRVLDTGGCAFVTQWSPRTLPADARRVEGQRYIYASQPGQTKCRPTGDELTAEMKRVGMVLNGTIAERHSVRDGEERVAIVGIFEKR